MREVEGEEGAYLAMYTKYSLALHQHNIIVTKPDMPLSLAQTTCHHPTNAPALDFTLLLPTSLSLYLVPYPRTPCSLLIILLIFSAMQSLATNLTSRISLTRSVSVQCITCVRCREWLLCIRAPTNYVYVWNMG